MSRRHHFSNDDELLALNSEINHSESNRLVNNHLQDTCNTDSSTDDEHNDGDDDENADHLACNTLRDDRFDYSRDLKEDFNELNVVQHQELSKEVTQLVSVELNKQSNEQFEQKQISIRNIETKNLKKLLKHIDQTDDYWSDIDLNELPPHWYAMAGKRLQVVHLTDDHPEFIMFGNQLKEVGLHVKSVERLQNTYLLSRFKSELGNTRSHRDGGTLFSIKISGLMHSN